MTIVKMTNVKMSKKQNHTQSQQTLNATSTSPQWSIMHKAIHTALSGVIFLGCVNALAETSAIDLQKLDINAPRVSDTQPVKGYNAKKSSSSTRTDTELRDTPQAITVIPQDLIKDQSILSISQAIQ